MQSKEADRSKIVRDDIHRIISQVFLDAHVGLVINEYRFNFSIEMWGKSVCS